MNRIVFLRGLSVSVCDFIISSLQNNSARRRKIFSSERFRQSLPHLPVSSFPDTCQPISPPLPTDTAGALSPCRLATGWPWGSWAYKRRISALTTLCPGRRKCYPRSTARCPRRWAGRPGQAQISRVVAWIHVARYYSLRW